MFDRRAGDQGADEARHEELFTNCQREHGKPLKEPPGARKFFGAKMNTAAHCLCQTRGRRTLAKFLPFLALAVALWPLTGTPAPAEPPAWQRELDAVRLAEATAALATANKPAGAEDAERRLAQLYRQLSAKYPDQAAVRKAAGDYFWKTGDTVTAVSEWQAAQALAPGDADTASALGSAWLRAGQIGAARTQFQRAVDARPDVARYHFDLANVLYLFRHQIAAASTPPDEAAVLRDAMGHFRRASELAADNLDFARAYAETFYGLPQPDWTEALAAWEHVRDLSAAGPDYADSHLARVSLKLGEPERAEGYLAAIHDPTFAPMKEVLHRRAEQMKQDQRNSVPNASR